MSDQVELDDDKIEVCVVGADDCDRLMEFLHIHYYREEPLTAGCEPPEPDEEDQKFLISNIPHGACLLAIHQGRIVGGAVSGPKLPDEAEHLVEEAERLQGTKWGRILGFLAIVEREANIFQRYGVDKALHLHALGVDAALRGRRIGERIMTALAERGRELGYPVLTTDCTSVYSARLMKRVGFELINSIPYTRYADANGEQLIRPPPPHEQVDTFALRL